LPTTENKLITGYGYQWTVSENNFNKRHKRDTFDRTLTLLATLTFILCLTCLVTNAAYPYYLIGLLWIGIITYTFSRIERSKFWTYLKKR